VDKLDQHRRSDNMRRIRHQGTKPEILVRKMVTRLGYRYRLHLKDLPGKPDLTFRKRKCVIFVHGCFWHQHDACREGRIPSTRKEYWVPKLAGNVARDLNHLRALENRGWRVLTIWECETNDPELAKRIKNFLE
jgi:DNA mismatch endonuclease (patch repair protein)